MRILTVTHFFESHGGGIERVAGHLNRQFTHLGVTAVWAASSSDEPPSGVGVEAVPLRCVNPIEKLTGLPMPIPNLSAISALHGAIKVSDAVIVHDALYVTSIAALVLGKLSKKPVILVQHIAEIAFPSMILRLLMKVANLLVTRSMIWAADEVVFISATVRGQLAESSGRSSHLLFNGVDHVIFHAGEVDGSNPFSIAGPSSRAAPQVLFVGRYVEKKGLAVLHMLAKMRQDLDFLLVGSGPLKPDAWGLSNVRDLGVLRPNDLANLYRCADMLLLPSIGEGYPLVIQEAMACGLPVICGEPSDRADPHASRWLRGVKIDLADPLASADRCAKAIDTISLSREERLAMADYAARNYDWEAMARGLVKLAASGHRATS